MAQGRVKDLESLFHRSEAELAAALSDKRGLESSVAELRAQLAKAGFRGALVWGRPGASGRVRVLRAQAVAFLSGVSGFPTWRRPIRVCVFKGIPRAPRSRVGRQMVTLACCPVSPRRRTVTRWPKSSWRRRR